MRGRLIKPLLVTFSRVDKSATAPQQDDIFREPVAERPFGARGERVSGVRYQAAIQLRAQVEVTTINRQAVGPGGSAPDYRTAFVCHYRDLEAAGLVDAATGHPLIGNGDRVDAIHGLDGTPERVFADPPVHVVEARDLGMGLGGRKNLVMFVTSDRAQGLKKSP